MVDFYCIKIISIIIRVINIVLLEQLAVCLYPVQVYTHHLFPYHVNLKQYILPIAMQIVLYVLSYNSVLAQAVALAGGSSDPPATNSSIREESHGMAPEAGQCIV